jgi:hypothetical protein
MGQSSEAFSHRQMAVDSALRLCEFAPTGSQAPDADSLVASATTILAFLEAAPAAPTPPPAAT